ncbi:MAG: flavodoxin family protein [Bacillota bacterium]
MAQQITTALVLNGELSDKKSLQGYSDAVERVLKKYEVEHDPILLRKKEIANCKGCFHCWVKTPGTCIIDDFSRVVTKLFANADLAVFITPLVYGGYSSELKKALDRIIPFISPYFTTVNGETHHKKRYKKSPALVGIGVTDQDNPEQESTFRKLLLRNSINMHSPFQDSLVFKEDQEMPLVSKKIEDLLGRVVI